MWIVKYKKGDSMSEKERPQLIIDYEANTDKLVRLGDVVDQFIYRI